MKYKDAEALARLERSRKAALTLTKLAGWNIGSTHEILASGLGEQIYVPEADLLIIAGFSDGRRDKGNNYILETRSSALFAELGKTRLGHPTIYISIGRCSRGQVHWHDELRLWTLGRERELWLLPDPDGSSAGDAAFLLERTRLRLSDERPWRNLHEHGFGFGCADTLLMNSGAF